MDSTIKLELQYDELSDIHTSLALLKSHYDQQIGYYEQQKKDPSPLKYTCIFGCKHKYEGVEKDIYLNQQITDTIKVWDRVKRLQERVSKTMELLVYREI